ncbi:hypothetical protein [Chryseobacterium binzhouense]|uniref:hypothetical protein n=1 Tax=Chryseobacterium binzhouense TaxID=2593646 RepID=UPI00117CF488|nr:hypothetical protein [Chryseobacterium binzhouense]
MKKTQLLELIEKGYVDNTLTKYEIKKVIDCSKGDIMINLFNEVFKDFNEYKNKKFHLTAELMNSFLEADKDLEIHFIDDGNGLAVAYHLEGEKYCYVDNKPPREIISDFPNFKNKFLNNHKSKLKVPQENECPDFVVIPHEDIKKFKHKCAELYLSVYNERIVPRRAFRVNFVMKYINDDNSVSMCFDTFDPHP